MTACLFRIPLLESVVPIPGVLWSVFDFRCVCYSKHDAQNSWRTCCASEIRAFQYWSVRRGRPKLRRTLPSSLFLPFLNANIFHFLTSSNLLIYVSLRSELFLIINSGNKTWASGSLKSPSSCFSSIMRINSGTAIAHFSAQGWHTVVSGGQK